MNAMHCPYCKSADVSFKKKSQHWECNDCEQTFEGTAPQPIAVDQNLLTSKTAHPKAIFFSYGHDANQELVDLFKEGLERRGHSVWIDYKQIGTWDDWKGAITKGIHDSDLSIAFLSKHATRDPGVCRNEIAMALNRFGTVYPILLEPFNEVTPPVTISHLQWEDLSQWRAIRDGKVSGKDWARWYEEKLINLITLLEGDATEFEGDIRSLREVLKPLSFTADIARHIPDFTGRQWVFDAYQDWLENKKDSRLFWLKAGPGVGKTAIASMLAHAHQAAVVGAWFCQASSIERRDARRAICSLAFQLATRWDDYRRKLRFQLGFTNLTGPDDWKGLHEELMKKNEADLFNHLFSEPLQGLIWRDQRLVVMIDALDEATDAYGQNPLVDLLVTRLAHLPEWLNFVVTSRPNPEVVSRLQGFAPFELDAHDPRNNDDLKAYLEKGLSEREDFKALNEEAQTRIVNSLLEKSEGMILYMQQILKGLAEGALNLATIEQAPKGLGSLYRIAFDHLYGGARLNDVYDDEVKPLLRLLLAAPEEMPVALAMEVLGWDKETWLRRRNRLGAYVIDTEQGCKLFHKTLYEWLQAEESAPYFIDASPTQRQLAELLWASFDARGENKQMQWQRQVNRLLPAWLHHTPAWQESASLNTFAEYLLDISGVAHYLRGGMSYYENVQPILERALQVQNEAGDGKDRAVMATSLMLLGYFERSWGGYDKAKALARFKESLAIRRALMEELGTPDSRRKYATALNAVAEIETLRGDWYAALPRFEESLAINRALMEEQDTPGNRRDYTLSLDCVALIEKARGDLDAALPRFEESLAINRALMEELGTPDSRRDYAFSLERVADIEKARGDLDRALARYEESLAIRRALMEELGTRDSRDYTETLNSVANIEKARGDLDAALARYEESLAIRRALMEELGTPDSRLDYTISLERVANIEKERGDLDGALARYEESLAINRALMEELGTSYSRRIYRGSLIRVGDIEKVRGDLDGALARYEESLAMSRALMEELGTPDSRRNYFYDLIRVAGIEQTRGDLDGALARFEESLAITRALMEELGTPQSRTEFSEALALVYYFKRVKNLRKLIGALKAAITWPIRFILGKKNDS